MEGSGTYLNKRSAAVTDQTGRVFTVEHEFAQDSDAEQHHSADIICPFQYSVPAGPVVGHMLEALIFQSFPGRET